MRALIALRIPSACFACAAASSSNCSRYCCGQYARSCSISFGPACESHDTMIAGWSISTSVACVVIKVPPRGVRRQ